MAQQSEHDIDPDRKESGMPEAQVKPETEHSAEGQDSTSDPAAADNGIERAHLHPPRSFAPGPVRPDPSPRRCRHDTGHGPAVPGGGGDAAFDTKLVEH